MDVDAGKLRLSNSKTGAKEVQLGDPAIAVLGGIPGEEASPWVIAGLNCDVPMHDLRFYWHCIRNPVGLGGVSLDDLRHR